MNKFLVSGLAVSLFAITASYSRAASLPATAFNVSASLSSACRVVPAAVPVLNFGTYTAFGSATTPSPTATIGVECTRNLATPTLAFDTGTGAGVILGLTYNVASATASAVGTAATATVAGTPDLHTITLTGSMAAGQAGDCTAATCTATVARTLTISY